MKTLRELELQINYRSGQNKLLEEFYIPCLNNSVRYRRAVGYFTSSGLSAAAKGLAVFIKGQGTMQLVASPYFNDEDLEAIKLGYDNKEDIINRSLIKELEDINSRLEKDRIKCLAWLISIGRLEIKIAIPVNELGDLTGSLYHEKIGIFTDDEDNAVAFIGSPNETRGGLVSNFESIDVFWSWDDPQARVKSKIDDFEKLWNDHTQKLKIFSFPDAVERALLMHKPASPPIKDYELSKSLDIKEDPQIPKNIELRDYQNLAIENWFENNCQGIMKMATGTGKTITALAAMTKLWRILQNENSGLGVVVVCPFTHLVDQWAEVCADFNFLPLRCYGSSGKWTHVLNELITDYNAKAIDLFCAIVTNASFRSEQFQDRIKKIRQPFLLIGDEVHNLGAKNILRNLPDNSKFRLGLSATPERWFDEEGTESIQEYFGPSVFNFGLKEAIESKALTPYNYYPILIELTEKEAEEYLSLSEKIAQLYHMTEGEEKNSGPTSLDHLLFKRARLIASAENKLIALKDIFLQLSKSRHNLIYCGDGRVECEPDEVTESQLRAVVKMLGKEMDMKVNSYTADTFLDRRNILRNEFASGEIQCLVAIRCLDEGVDIPETKRAFILASSRNPRQFIQRRGRVLRRAPKKEFAEIYDFIVIPPSKWISHVDFRVERNLVEKELIRFSEFAKLARNGPQASESLLPLKEKYNLLHV